MVERIREGDIPGVQLRRRQRLGLSTEQAWLWMTDPEQASRWLADRVSWLGDRGETLHLESRVDGRPLIERGTVEKAVPLRLLELSFERLDERWQAPTRLTFEIGAGPSGSELSVFHAGFQRLPLSQCLTIWEFYRRRWHSALRRLDEISHR